MELSWLLYLSKQRPIIVRENICLNKVRKFPRTYLTTSKHAFRTDPPIYMSCSPEGMMKFSSPSWNLFKCLTSQIQTLSNKWEWLFQRQVVQVILLLGEVTAEFFMHQNVLCKCYFCSRILRPSVIQQTLIGFQSCTSYIIKCCKYRKMNNICPSLQG